MAWTSPRTWVAGETVTAAELNTHVRDNLKVIGDAWTTYTPTLTASTTDPTLGSGSSATGAYIAAGKLIIGRARIVFGASGTAAGTGNYFVSIPVTARATTDLVNGSCRLVHSTTTIARPFPALTTTSLLVMEYPATWPSDTQTLVGDSAPWAWGASDSIDITFIYEAA